jgi:hypothetical protein
MHNPHPFERLSGSKKPRMIDAYKPVRGLGIRQDRVVTQMETWQA